MGETDKEVNKERLYTVPEGISAKFKKFIEKHNLYLNEDVLYKVGIY